ncbi:MAG TPA: hypothetical protein VNN72_14795, partial [Polyangiaceae bacterium]|nr:hypothetical protein [Polyangiaceae bacterium]
MKRLLVLGFCLSTLGLVGCGNDEEKPPPGAAHEGAGGETASGDCPSNGTGTVIVEVTGLSADVEGSVEVTRGGTSQTLTETTTLDDETTGTVVVTAKRVTDSDPIVRTVFDPVVTNGSFCLEDGDSHTVSVSYAAIPSSNRLWTSNLLGFDSASLAVPGDVRADVFGSAPIGKDVAFDRNGNLWSLGATLAEKMLVRVPAENLATSGMNDFDREIDVPEIECLPALKAMAFDPRGNLWLGACGGNILELPASSLAHSGEAAASTVLSGIDDSADLAFDAEGNLWVATGATILRYDAHRLSASSADAADLTLTPRDVMHSRDLGATGLAFDAHGNLWGFDFGSNTIFELAAADLEANGEQTVVSKVSFVVGVLSLLDRGAFDDGGGLWISYAIDQLARLSPQQLTESAGTGDPVTPDRIVTSRDLDSELRIAL